MTDLVYSIADFLQWTFGILTTLENLPNVIFVILGFVGAIYWLVRQRKYTREDSEAGRLV